MKFHRWITMAMSAGWMLGVFSSALIAQETSENSAAEILGRFETQWDEAAWETPFRTFPTGYIRPLDDPGLELRMKSLQEIVSLGEAARTDLLAALESASAPVRMLAAQAIGFLGAEAPGAELMAIFSQEPDPSVRLYLADSLGRCGIAATLLQALHDLESNSDVKKHLNYAMERRGEKLDPKIRQSLLEYDLQKIESVKLGQPAPDFALQSADGQPFRLSDQQGKSAVILVFVYGDT